MSETSLWTWLRGKLPPGHYSRLESETSPGIPDVSCRVSGRQTWLELKFLRKKNLPFGEDGLRQSQKTWITDELEHGGRVWIVAQVGKFVFVVDGIHALSFNDYGLDEMTESSTLMFSIRTHKNEVGHFFKQLLSWNVEKSSKS